MASGPIPVSMIERYAEKRVLRLTFREQLAFKSILRSIDAEYLTIESERAKAATKARK